MPRQGNTMKLRKGIGEVSTGKQLDEWNIHATCNMTWWQWIAKVSKELEKFRRCIPTSSIFHSPFYSENSQFKQWTVDIFCTYFGDFRIRALNKNEIMLSFCKVKMLISSGSRPWDLLPKIGGGGQAGPPRLLP